MEIRAGFDLHFRLCENRGFAPSSRREQLPTGQLHLMGWSFCLQPAINSFADCPLEPLEYRIMAGIAGFEPAVPVSKTGALTPWLYPIVMVIRAGLEPSITALKGLCPDRLDERTIWGASPPDQATVVTRISSMRTLSRAARTIRLSTVGRAVPFCHL